MSRAAAYKARRTNKRFADKWEEAIDVATDAMELEARRRAMSGVEEPIYYKGQQVGYARKYSDILLMFLIKAQRPAKYRDHHTIDAKVEGRIEVASVEALEAKILGMAVESEEPKEEA